MTQRHLPLIAGASTAALVLARRLWIRRQLATLTQAKQFVAQYYAACEAGLPVAAADQLDKTVADLSEHLDQVDLGAVRRVVTYGLATLARVPNPTSA